MKFNILMGLRIAQLVFALVVLGLSAYVSDWWMGFWETASPSQVNFLLFASVWTLVALGYLVVAPWKMQRFAHPYAVAGVEAVTTLFWFAGFVASAVFITQRVCFGGVCNVGRASVAFGALETITFIASLALSVIHVLHSRKSGSSAPAGPPPQMSSTQA